MIFIKIIKNCYKHGSEVIWQRKKKWFSLYKKYDNRGICHQNARVTNWQLIDKKENIYYL